ncbi:MAG: MMPL family transporter, partial [Bifidobacteriaceae bacterium]|nr:MMPL family transporter [Bifidobacteriaceae bacterium]
MASTVPHSDLTGSGTAPSRRPNVFVRIATWSARHRRITIIGWICFVLLASSIAGAITPKQASDTASMHGESQTAMQVAENAGESQPVVEYVLITNAKGGQLDTDRAAAALQDLQAAAKRVQYAHIMDPASMASEDGQAVTLRVQLDATSKTAPTRVVPLQKAVAKVASRYPGLKIEETGQASIAREGDNRVVSDMGRAAVTSVPVTLIILLIAFAAILMAVVPVIIGLGAVASAVGLWAVASQAFPDQGMVRDVIILMGMAVGVDYSLFFLRRYREELHTGKDAQAAIAATAATAGHSVIVSGTAVSLALLATLLLNDTFFSGMGVGAIIVVVIAMASSVTMLPALAASLARFVDRPRLPWVWRLTGRDQSRVMPAIMKPVIGHPAVSVIIAVVVLGALAIPATGMKLKLSDTDDMPRSLTTMASYDRLLEHFPGSASADRVVVRFPASQAIDHAAFEQALQAVSAASQQEAAAAASAPSTGTGAQGASPAPTAADAATAPGSGTAPSGTANPGNPPTSGTGQTGQTSQGSAASQAMAQIAAALPPSFTAFATALQGHADLYGSLSNAWLSADGRVLILDIEVPHASESAAAQRSVTELRNAILPDTFKKAGAEAWVGGMVALNMDYTAHLRSGLGPLLAIILVVTLLFMFWIYRSVAIGVATMLLNLLSALAAFGVLVLVFQRHWAEGLLAFRSNGTVASWVPLLLFVILSGLSLDYHVFVLSRVQEFERAGVEPREAVRRGVIRTAGVVTSAAVVMVGVFLIFATLSFTELKEIGVGLAVAVILDATVIRMVALPAILVLCRRFLWWPGRRGARRAVERTMADGGSVPALAGAVVAEAVGAEPVVAVAGVDDAGRVRGGETRETGEPAMAGDGAEPVMARATAEDQPLAAGVADRHQAATMEAERKEPPMDGGKHAGPEWNAEGSPTETLAVTPAGPAATDEAA